MKKTSLLIVFVLFVGALSAYSQANRTIKLNADDTPEQIVEKAAMVRPTPNQYNFKKLEFTCFVHFGPNTFSRMEWGNGFEDPQIFNLQNLDTDQWCETARAAGMKAVVFTAKHHDGFCLWQSRYTKHGVMSSPFKNGKGDVLGELSESCRKYGLKLGVYLSPADLFQIENKDGLYGNLSEYSEREIPRKVEGRPFVNKTTFKAQVDDYNEYFMNQLFELLTEYGPIHEVWFDGAHPKRKGGQTYNYLAWKELINTLAPDAVIFGKDGVRWCGNESGRTRESEWDVVTFDVDPALMNMFPDMHGDLGSRAMLQPGKFLHYLPAETNTSIREGWFYRDDDKQRVRSADDVFDMYERSVGGNSTFLLNIPPNRDGKFSDEDVEVLREVGARIRATYSNDLLKNADGDFALLDKNEHSYVSGYPEGSEWIIELPEAITMNRFVLQEAIQYQGQRVEEHALDVWKSGSWQIISEGTVIGYKKIHRFREITTDKIRIRILKSRLNPSLSGVSAHYYTASPPVVEVSRSLEGYVSLIADEDDFSWKKHGVDFRENLSDEIEIRYTVDGSEPDSESTLYTEPIFLESGIVKARSFDKSLSGSVSEVEFGLIKKKWKTSASELSADYSASYVLDGDVESYWTSGSGEPEIMIDLKRNQKMSGFIYTPPTRFKEGLIERGRFEISSNGKKWTSVQEFDLGNLINDPTARTVHFEETVKARYIKVVSIRGAGGSKSASAAEIDVLGAK